MLTRTNQVMMIMMTIIIFNCDDNDNSNDYDSSVDIDDEDDDNDTALLIFIFLGNFQMLIYSGDVDGVSDGYKLNTFIFQFQCIYCHRT